MVNEIILDKTAIKLDQYKEDIDNGLITVSIVFQVTSEDYHDIATLLYKGTFDINVPDRNLTFKGTIKQYYTSITNLYEKGQVGEYSLILQEIKRPERGQK
ncbi:DUF3219 family protein [Terrilactibacillus laevilacticus]|uniref:DUF3219 family protein n=1 Tax=Terrilactibacillus laevilacticus TaxID=1380157 RepID=UPI0011477578|nr:DUF3219 family protein [Terrilactibacillus laevilacticus]